MEESIFPQRLQNDSNTDRDNLAKNVYLKSFESNRPYTI